MDKKISIKLLVDTRANRVLFAESGKEFIDFLFSLLTLPIGEVIKLLSKEQMVGSIGDLYSSLEQLEESYLLSSEKRSSLLNPPVISMPIPKNSLLLSPSPVTNYKKFYSCGHCNKKKNINSYSYNTIYGRSNIRKNNNTKYVTDAGGTQCPSCGRPMSSEMQYVGSNQGDENHEREEGREGFVRGVVTYTIMDDLSVVPMSTISSITLLNKFQVKDLSSLQERNVKVGMEEGLKLLKTSLQSKTVLTTLFLGKKRQAI